MNNLEKKFKIPKGKVLIDEKLWKYMDSKIEKLEQQLDNQKYLDRVEVGKIVKNAWDNRKFGTGVDGMEQEIITAICNLAYKPITRDRIIGVLSENMAVLRDKNGWVSIILAGCESWHIDESQSKKDKLLERIATEILGKEGEE